MLDVELKVAPTAEAGDLRQSDGTNLIVLKGDFSSGDNSYKFELRSDGTGEIFYSDFPTDSEDFAHEIRVGELAGEIEQVIRNEITVRSRQNPLVLSEVEIICRETTSEMLEEVFWEEINQTLEDPFFRGSFFSEADSGEEFGCEQGTVDEFIEFLELCVLTEREIKDKDDYLIVEAETDFDLAGLSECSYFTERLAELVEIACGLLWAEGLYTYLTDLP